MGIVVWLKSAWQWLKALLNHKVTTADDFQTAVTQALIDCDTDADGNMSVREIISFVLRCL